MTLECSPKSKVQSPKSKAWALTLKALANSSPAVALWQPWDEAHLFIEALLSFGSHRKPVATPLELRRIS